MSFRGWQKTTINTSNGTLEGIAPIIISAGEDMPTFILPLVTCLPKLIFGKDDLIPLLQHKSSILSIIVLAVSV
jgi:hypothetical protein